MYLQQSKLIVGDTITQAFAKLVSRNHPKRLGSDKEAPTQSTIYWKNPADGTNQRMFIVQRDTHRHTHAYTQLKTIHENIVYQDIFQRWFR